MTSLTRKILILLLVMTAVGAGSWFGHKAYGKYIEGKFVTQARQRINKGDWKNAWMSLQRAMQVNPGSPEASEALADFLDAQGHPSALSWRIRAAQLAPTKRQYRLAWAKTAIKMQDFANAKAALDVLSPSDKDTLEYHKLAGALAWGLRDNDKAKRQYSQALHLEPTNPTTSLNLATIDLSSTNPAVAAAARSKMEQLSTVAEVRIPALRQLATEAVARKSFSAALSYSGRILQCPAATFGDRIDYLQILRAAKSADYDAYLTTLKGDAATNAAQVFAMGEWMATTESTTNALRWLQSLPPSMQTNQPVPMLVGDCLASLKEWQSLLDWVADQDWGQANYYRFALETLAHGSLKQEVAAKAAWQKALKLSYRRLERLSNLAQVSAKWGLEVEQVDVLREITSDFPRERWAAGALASEYHKQGNTSALADLLASIYAADPTDPKLKNTLATVSLLRKSDLERAHRMAKEAYESAPDNPFFASTYAYSLLLQDKPREASKIMSEVNTNFLQIPSIAAYYGVIQARCGHGDLAREPLKLAGKATLLPEERQIVQLAQSQL
jgi:Flp pilus assembly protein TadD